MHPPLIPSLDQPARRAAALPAMAAAAFLGMALALPAPLLAQDAGSVAGQNGPGPAPTGAAAVPDGGRDGAIAGAIAGTPEGMQAVAAWLDSVAGQPELVAARAAELIQGLHRPGQAVDLVELQQAADRIARSAGTAMETVRIVQTEVDPAFAPGGGRIGLNFGTPDAPPLGSFEKLNARDARISGVETRGVRRPAADGLLADGVIGVERVSLTVPNGKYRVILLTDNISMPEIMQAPLGKEIVINGRVWRVAGGGPEAWAKQLSLGAQSDSASGRPGAHFGGAVVLEAEILDGKLDLELRGSEGRTYLTGMVLEPIDLPSVVTRRAEAAESHAADRSGRCPSCQGLTVEGGRRAAAEAQINSAVGQVLAQAATAAGPQQVAQVIDLPQPAVEPPRPVSPN